MNDRDIDTIKARFPVLEVAREFAELRARTLDGPCPRCGGTDRFYVHQHKNFWGCRKCHSHGGDVLDLVRFVKGGSLGDAIDYLVGPRPPKREWLEGDDLRYRSAPKKPIDLTRYVRECHEELAMVPEGMDYLRKRGLEKATWRAFRLGWKNPQGFIVIPWISASMAITAVKLRDPRATEKRKRFKMVYGSVPTVFGANVAKNNPLALIVEGEFNMMSCWQVSKDLSVDCFSTGSESRQSIIPAIAERYERVVLWVDSPLVAERARGRFHDLPLRVVSSTAGMDANDILVTKGPDVLRGLIQHVLGRNNSKS